MVADTEELEIFGRARNPCSKAQCQGGFDAEGEDLA